MKEQPEFWFKLAREQAVFLYIMRCEAPCASDPIEPVTSKTLIALAIATMSLDLVSVVVVPSF